MASPIDFHADLRVTSTTPPRTEAYIPASTIQVHASNLLLLPSGELLCAWFGGSMEGISDIYIWLSRLAPGANEWTTPMQVSEDPARSEQNPVLFLDERSGNLWCIYTAQEHGAQNKCLVRRRISTDLGKTWGEPAELFPDRGIFVRQPIIVLNDKNGPGKDVWVLPVFHCRAEEGVEWVGNDDVSAVRYSEDSGKTWKESMVPESRGAVHMNIRPDPSSPGKYVGVYRSRWADNIYLSRSDDCINWTKPEPTELPNPNSGICLGVLPKSGKLALVYNDSRATPDMVQRTGLYDDIETDGPKLKKQAVIGDKAAIWGTPRSKMTLALSSDGGRTWPEKRLLEEGDGFCLTNNSKDKINRELSYPSITVADDETMHIAFTFWRQRIKYVKVKADWVKG
ncbi:hypothetical protein MCOR25_000804 [Pyricularia grisea]|nr:hypothetical protein MCOR25_000804 [Pyricularia grisea]